MIFTYWMQITTNVLWRNHFVLYALFWARKKASPNSRENIYYHWQCTKKLVKNLINTRVFNRSFEHFWSFARTWKLIEKLIESLRTAIVSLVINQIWPFIDYCASFFERNLQSNGPFLGECYCAILKPLFILIKHSEDYPSI